MNAPSAPSYDRMTRAWDKVSAYFLDIFPPLVLLLLDEVPAAPYKHQYTEYNCCTSIRLGYRSQSSIIWQFADERKVSAK